MLHGCHEEGGIAGGAEGECPGQCPNPRRLQQQHTKREAAGEPAARAHLTERSVPRPKKLQRPSAELRKPHRLKLICSPGPSPAGTRHRDSRSRSPELVGSQSSRSEKHRTNSLTTHTHTFYVFERDNVFLPTSKHYADLPSLDPLWGRAGVVQGRDTGSETVPGQLTSRGRGPGGPPAPTTTTGNSEQRIAAPESREAEKMGKPFS